MTDEDDVEDRARYLHRIDGLAHVAGWGWLLASPRHRTDTFGSWEALTEEERDGYRARARDKLL